MEGDNSITPILPRTHRTERIGREGSRRRNRKDNDRFVGHPCAVLTASDLTPPGYPLDAPSFHFSPDYIDLPYPTVLVAHPAPHHPATALKRGVRRDIRRRGEVEAVRRVEEEVRAFALGQPPAEAWDLLGDASPGCASPTTEDYIPIETPPVTKDSAALSWDLPSAFDRFILHSVCAWYGLTSRSIGGSSGMRTTWIHRPVPEAIPRPPMSFVEYVFA